MIPRKMKSGMLRVAVAALVGAGVAYILGTTVFLNFKSEGLLNADLTVSEYKRITESLSAPASAKSRLEAFPSQILTEEDLVNISNGSAPKWYAPVARVSKAEAKDLPDAVLKLEFDKEKPSDLVRPFKDGQPDLMRPYSGIRITAKTADPQRSAALVKWLGEYFRDSAAKELLRTEIFEWVASNQAYLIRAQEDRIRLVYEQEQSQVRANSLRKVLSQYPELAKIDTRTIVDVRKDNEKFVSPGGQLVAAEVEMINLKETQTRLERQVLQSEFIAPYLGASEKFLTTSKSGVDLVSKLNELTKSYMQKVQTEAQREVLLSKAAKIAEISARFFSRTQFISPPSVPDRAEAPRPNMLAAIGGLLLGLLTLMWLLRHRIIASFKDDKLNAKGA